MMDTDTGKPQSPENGNTLSSEQIHTALAVSPGIAVGRACSFKSGALRFAEPEKKLLGTAGIEDEIRRFEAAIAGTRDELMRLQTQLKKQLNADEAAIFDAHLLILADIKMIADVEKRIRENLECAGYAFYAVVERYASTLSAMSDEYLRERASDIRDVGARVLGRLERAPEHADERDDRRILVASELSPSETAMLDPCKILGFVLENGSSTSHSAILARSMRLPALVGIDHALIEKLSVDDRLIVDGFTGRLIVNPDRRTEEAYRLKSAETGKLYSDLERDSALDSETPDGFRVELALNLETADGVADLKKVGAKAVGLFRTEYLYMNTVALPGEETQFQAYRALLAGADDAPVVIRTLDAGGDKLPGALHFLPESNPFLGVRGIRLCLRERRDIFKTQLRALLRAGVYGNLRVMLPMIASLDEIRETRALVEELQKALAAEGAHHVPHLALGAMIETPAAALQVEKIAREVDFLSIGTNDLTQYTFAADRTNERVAYLQQTAHPAVLALIDRCVRAAVKNHIWCGVCGQMASEPLYAVFLLGMGVHELSMDPNSIGVIRRVIRSVRLHEAESALAEALECDSAPEALAVSRRLLTRVAPEIVSLTANEP